MNAATPETSAPSVILLIDDNEANLGVLANYLKRLGFKILTARNGGMGLQRAQLAKPDLILLDVLMPDIDGFEVCRRLKADPDTQEIPVIFITALQSVEDTVKGFAAGGVDYITKPIRQEDVFARVTTHLSLRKAQRQLQESNAHLEATLNALPDLLFELDRDGRIYDFRAPRPELLYTTPEAFLGRTVRDVLPQEAADVTEEALADAAQTGQHFGGVYTLKLPKGVTWFEISIAAKGDRASPDCRFILLVRDITERKQAEEGLKRLNAELHDANAGKDRLFSIIAHDLRSPFTVLIGLADIVLHSFDKLPPDDLKAKIEQIKSSAETVYKLLENLLTWSRIQRGLMKSTPQHIALRPLVEHIVNVCAPHADQKRMTVENHVPDGLAVYADSDMLSTVIRNLVSNAVKFTQPGGMVNISAHPGEHGITIAIADTGIGIAPEQLAALFRIDRRVKSLGTAGETGSGLGLPLCKDLVEQQGGRIDVKSEPGRGTTFTCTVRAGRNDTAAVPAASSDDAAAHADERPPSINVTADDLADLPEDLYCALRGAVEAIDVEGTLALVEQVNRHKPSLAHTLKELVSGYRFDVLHELFAKK